MKLTDNVLEEIKKIVDDCQNKIFDQETIEEIIDLLNQNRIFFKTIEYDFDGYYDAYTDMYDGIIHFNYELLLRNYSSLYDKLIDVKDKTYATNLNIISVILHECTHLEQFLYSKENYPYEDIINLYNLYRESSDNIRFRIMYQLFNLKFSFERHANITSYYYVEQIANSELKKVIRQYFIYCFFNGYYEMKKKIICPVDITLKLIGKRYPIDINKVPLKERLIHGLLLTEQEYSDIIKPYDGYNLTDIEYDPLIKKITK